MAVYCVFACICYLWSMNKQAWMIQKTTSDNINIYSLLSLLLSFRSSRKVRSTYHINTVSIVVLMTCYIHYRYINPLFSIYGLRLLNTSYSYMIYRKYVSLLLELKMITQAGKTKFTFTDFGLDIIKQISDNSYTIMYDFCQKYNIEL